MGSSDSGTSDGKIVLVFPGQGSQWPAMATELLATSTVFRDRISECAAALDPLTGWSLIDLLHQAPTAPSLDRVDVVQPALFAVMVSLAELWQSLGIQPDAVTGHSQGEIAAACVAGALTLPDAARIVALRSQALRQLEGHGAMASIPLPASQVSQDLTGYPTLAIAAIAAGDSGADGMQAKDRPVPVPDFLATVCKALGVDPMGQNLSDVGRPIRIVDPKAKAIREVLA